MTEFRSRHFFVTALLALVAGTTALVPGTAKAASNYSFGITNDGYIYQIDLSTKTESLIFDTGFHSAAASAGPNGLAWDEATRSLYYRKSSGAGEGLYRVNFSGATPTQSLLTTFSGSLNAGANGAVYNNSYWYITEGTSNLMRVSNLGSASGVTVTAYNNFDGAAYTGTYNFGDIAITSAGMMYGQTSSGEFFKADISGIANSTATIATDYLRKSINGSRQLTFGQDGTLYSHETGTGKFFTVNYATGANFGVETLYSSGITPPGGSVSSKFNDLADTTATPVAVPEANTVLLLGLACPMVGMVLAARRKK